MFDALHDRVLRETRSYGRAQHVLYALPLAAALWTSPAPPPEPPAPSYTTTYATALPHYARTAEYARPVPFISDLRPHWMKPPRLVSRAEIGGAFGMARLDTGETFIDYTLSPERQEEVGFHERLHIVYSNASERMIRGMVIATRGPENAQLHMELGLRGT